jgi:hypothetical protein
MYSRNLLFISLIAILAGCSSSQKFGASFIKRRYNKGYYKDAVAYTEVKKNAVVINEFRGKVAPPQGIVAGNAEHVNKTSACQEQSHAALKKENTVYQNRVVEAIIKNMLPVSKGDPNLKKFDDSPDPGRQGFYIEMAGIALTVLMYYLSFVISFLGVIGAIAGVIMFITGFVFCILSLTYPDDRFHTLAIIGIVAGTLLAVVLIYALVHWG